MSANKLWHVTTCHQSRCSISAKTRIEAPPKSDCNRLHPSDLLSFATEQNNKNPTSLPTTVSHRNSPHQTTLCTFTRSSPLACKLPAPNNHSRLTAPQGPTDHHARPPFAPDNPTCQKMKLVAIACYAGPGQDYQTEVRGTDSKKVHHAEVRVSPSQR